MATTIAIIEDNVELLSFLTSIIRAEPDFILAGTAINGTDGLALINASRADVYLVDLDLPDMDGAEVVRHAIAVHPSSEVIVINAFADETHIVKSIQAGANGYLMKDNSLLELVKYIRSVCNGGSPFTPAITRKVLGSLRRNYSLQPPDRVNSLRSASIVLTDRETQILELLSRGLSYKEISRSLDISAYTVAQHLRNIYPKLAVHSRGEAIYTATKLGLIKA